MADDPKSKPLNIPEETKQKFPDLIEHIEKSESMDQEERQYWIDALPIMTDEQLENLRGILKNEQEQIEKTKRRSEKSIQENVKKYAVRFDDFKYKEKKRILMEKEAQTEQEEKKEEASLLKEIDTLG